MIYEGKIYKAKSDDITFIPKGDLIQTYDCSSKRAIKVIHYQHTGQKSFADAKTRELSEDQIKVFFELQYDLKSLL